MCSSMESMHPHPETLAETLIAGAITRIGADPVRLQEMAFLCDTFSRIREAEQRDLVVSIAALTAYGEPADRSPGRPQRV
jgi:hypothetical protein